jgi:hypothetical protein
MSAIGPRPGSVLAVDGVDLSIDERKFVTPGGSIGGGQPRVIA